MRRGTAKLLPGGLDTAGQHLLAAENEAGQVVGNAWVGPELGRVTDGAGSAWLYDINVFEQFRRHGYGTAILAAVEEFVGREGMTALGLNVVGDNDAAIALYRRCGYAVSSMSMRKSIG